MLRRFRLTPGSSVLLAAALVLGLAGLLLLTGTMDEYRAGRAFDRAMDSYSAQDLDKVHIYLDEAIAAKGSYTAPQEVKGKLFIDEGPLNPVRFDEAVELFQQLATLQENARWPGGQVGPSLPVLIGRAVAELEAARAKSPNGVPSARALAEARHRLERAAEQYPDSGDLCVNLATVALFEGNLAKCRQYLDKVREVGKVSLDALPYLYNLWGLVEIREGRLENAVLEFENVAQFRPAWTIPRLNLAAAYAQSLIRGEIPNHVAAHYANTIGAIVGDLRKEKSPLAVPICHSLAVYNIRTEQPQRALALFEQAEAQGPLGWHARLNRAIAQYLAGTEAAAGTPQRTELLQKAREEFEQAIGNRLLTSRDKFAAYCILGTIHAQAQRYPEAIAAFHQAEDLASATAIAVIRQQLTRIQRNLAGLYYLTDDGLKAVGYLEKSKELPDARGEAQAMLARLRSVPTIGGLVAKVQKVQTEFDVTVAAAISVRATSRRLDPQKDVRLVLHNALTGEARPVPFLLEGTALRACLVNLPQGRFTVRLDVTDALGNTASDETPPFAFDREPPRLLYIEPAPNATVAKVGLIKFRLFDAISKPDLATLNLMVRYPGAAGAQKALVNRGHYRYASADGSVKLNDAATEAVTAPLPDPVAGTYTVMAKVADTLGKEAEVTWSFTLR